jgi:hypothetical protein
MQIKQFFLSDERRQALIDDLCGLGMPVNVTIRWAWVTPDLGSVDKTLAGAIKFMAHFVRKHAGEKIHEDEVFLSACGLIAVSYLAEIEERHIPRGLFPRTLHAMEEGVEVVKQFQIDALTGLTWAGEQVH